MIIHGHISVEGAVTRVPGMLVTKLQEKNINYSPSSALNSDLHPVRPGAQKTYDDSLNSDEEEPVEENETKEEPVEEKSETKEEPVEEKSETKEGEDK